MSESLSPPGGEQPPVRSQRPPFLTPAISLLVCAAAVAAAVLFAPNDFRLPLAIGASVAALLLTASVTAAVFYRGRARQLTREAHAYRAQADARVAATIAAAQARIAESESGIAALREQVAEQARAAKESENRRAAALAAFAGAAGRMQAASTSMLAELREMEHRHADPKVLADLLELDHRTAQAGRLADSIAVLSGARSGRRWAKPIAMESILRGAMGRVAGYQRVRLRAITEIAIAGHAAEGVMHALAELLDNACNFSPPTTEVHVYAAEVPAGVVITIEDSGLVMSESALRRAESAVTTRRRPTDLSSLSGTRLGLAVVGHLARKHDLTISYRPSAIGGTAVVVVVPRELTTRLERSTTSSRLTPLPATTGPQPAVPPRPAALTQHTPAAVLPTVHQPTAAAQLDTDRSVHEVSAAESGKIGEDSTTSGGLPKRRRGSTLASVHPDGLGAPAAPARPRPPASPNSLAAFQRAVTGRDSGGPAPAAFTNLDPAALTNRGQGSAGDSGTGRGEFGAGARAASLLDGIRRGESRRENDGGTPHLPAPPTSWETDR
ncbi:sensor histidine kinase [Nocardia yunnanensis]|uniref:sensor histidine kinase n=1 Tax=Nocardia yunnanensis TaxID=2382165 RepID=UPI0016573396|nr:ATP-binding protein [Nocardia yunnanensis]